MALTQINKAGLDEIALDHVFTIGASGSSAYTFQGEGLNGTVNNPTLYLTRGKTYRFENGSGGHPIRIQSTSGASGTAYNTGVTNNAGGGTVIVEVQHDAPDVLYYQCTSHAAMNGILYITGALADGGVTTAKIANDAVTTAKIANNAVTTAKIADANVTAAKLASGVQTTINNNADNRVITGSGTANTLNAESGVIIDSNGRLGINNSSPDRKLEVQNDGDYAAKFSGGSGSGHTSIEIGQVATNGSAGFNATGGSMLFDIAGAEKMRLDTSGRLQVGTTVGWGSNAKLHVSDTSSNCFVVISAADSGNSVLAFSDTAATARGVWDYDHADDSLHVKTAATERARFDNAGNLFVGKTSTTLATDGIRLDGSGLLTSTRSSTSTNGGTASGGCLVLCNSSNTDNNFSNIGFYKANGLVTSQINGVNVSQSNRHGALSFLTHNGSVLSEKMNIDQNGDVLIGASSWAYKKPLNVQGSSGAILALSNYDTTSYAANTNTAIELRVNTGNTGNQNGACEIRALKENGTNGNNARALSFYTGANGAGPSEKLRIQSGGGISFNGDTAAANALDDYEEGTWTATVNYGNHITTNAAYYTKIGNMVYWMLHFQATFAPNDTAVFNIYGLPFTSSNVTENYGWDAQITYSANANNTVIANMRPLVEKNNTYIYFHTVGLGSATRVLNNLIRSALVGNDTLMGGFYMAA